jgi:hypothetical protein
MTFSYKIKFKAHINKKIYSGMNATNMIIYLNK